MTPTAPTPRSARHRAARATATSTAGAALVVLALLSGCSTRGDAAPAEPTTTVAAEATTTTEADAGTPTTDPVEEPVDDPVEPDEPVEPVEPDEGSLDGDVEAARARAAAVNLTIDDLPVGWTAEPAVEEVETVVSTCTINGTDADLVAKAGSDRFSLVRDGGGLALETSTGVLDGESVASALMSELGSDEFAACATGQLLSAEGVTVDGALAPSDALPELGDEVVALQGDFAMSDETDQAQVSVIVVAIRTDQVITTVTATAVNTPGDEQLLYQVLDLVAERQATTA